MYKKILVILIAAMYLVSLPVALAGGPSGKIPQPKQDVKIKKLIALTTSSVDKDEFKKLGCTIDRELSDATAISCPPDVVGKLKVEVEENNILTIQDFGADQQIGADRVWNELGYTGSGIVVAVLDTGVDYTHPELQPSNTGSNAIANGGVAGGKSFVGYTNDFFDDQGHGTHVTGIITSDGAGNLNSKGVAPGASVWAGKVCDSTGSCYDSDIAAGIEYVVLGPDGLKNSGDEPAKIISISLGGGGTFGKQCNSYLARKVNWAVKNGATVAAAAGNAGILVSSPACAEKAIAVGAVDNNDVRAVFSGWGMALDIMAPGVDILSTLPGNSYAAWDGTSMATPHVSAVIALMRNKNPAIGDKDIKEILYTTATDLGSPGWDSQYGNGRVDAYSAVLDTPPP